MKISFIGFGHMAKAIVQGLSDLNHELRAAAPSLDKDTNISGVQTYNDNLAVLPGADAIILAVKPAQMSTVFNQIKSMLSSDSLIISIAAGLRLAWFQDQGSEQLPIVRAMPNLAASVGMSATPLFANTFVTSKQKKTVDQIFSKIGLTTWVDDESLIDIFTAFSGSGPAYLFSFMEAMQNAAVTLGLPSDIADSFALQLFEGSAGLAKQSALSFNALREQVTSPSGTTAAALEVFTQHKLDNVVYTAMKAAKERAQAISESYKSKL